MEGEKKLRMNQIERRKGWRKRDRAYPKSAQAACTITSESRSLLEMLAPSDNTELRTPEHYPRYDSMELTLTSYYVTSFFKLKIILHNND